jgi:hypothetical protein
MDQTQDLLALALFRRRGVLGATGGLFALDARNNFQSALLIFHRGRLAPFADMSVALNSPLAIHVSTLSIFVPVSSDNCRGLYQSRSLMCVSPLFAVSEREELHHTFCL